MSDSDRPITVSTPTGGSVDTWKETQRLINESVLAVSALSEHLKNVPDKSRMYKSNQALNLLWEIE